MGYQHRTNKFQNRTSIIPADSSSYQHRTSMKLQHHSSIVPAFSKFWKRCMHTYIYIYIYMHVRMYVCTESSFLIRWPPPFISNSGALHFEFEWSLISNALELEMSRIRYEQTSRMILLQPAHTCTTPREFHQDITSNSEAPRSFLIRALFMFNSSGLSFLIRANCN